MENEIVEGGAGVPPRHLPIATICVLNITAIITGLQFVFPAVLTAPQRSPAALAGGEWWRLITRLFVHPDGWSQIVVDFAGITSVGPVVERRFGSARWLVLYFVAGMSAEITVTPGSPMASAPRSRRCPYRDLFYRWREPRP